MINIKSNLNILNMSKVCCNICANDVYSSSIKECPYCLEAVCIKCIKHYILDIKNTQKKCMFCYHTFSRAILVQLLGNSYIQGNIYKNHIKELLFQEEKTLIPQSLPIIEQKKRVNEQYAIINDLGKNLDDKLKNGNIQNTMEEFNARGVIYSNTLYLNFLKNKSTYKKNILYKYPCAYNDCDGFVNSNWKCDLCDKFTCKDCFAIKDSEEHVCAQQDIDTTTLIKKNSKPCPKCNISIIKSDGCDQMWCVNCHTTFDWRTLQIKTGGVVHNPEYFRYMRDNGITITRNPNDNPCNNTFIEAFNLLTSLNNNYKKMERINTEAVALRKCMIYKYDITNAIQNSEIIFLFELYRQINHISDWELVRIRRIITNHTTWKNQERIRFLEKIINEKQYKTNLARKHKECEYINELCGVQNTIIEVCKDTFANICNELATNISEIIKNKETYCIIKSDKIIKLKEFIYDTTVSWNNINSIYSLNKNIEIPTCLL